MFLSLEPISEIVALQHLEIMGKAELMGDFVPCHRRRASEWPRVHTQELQSQEQEGNGAVHGRRGQPCVVRGEEHAVQPQ